MMNNNKILTVSYGTFSCTLEGFDDSFDTMKAIAEYFRDLAADDRYFGAEPPQPDADMLAKIAEREVSRRVEASEHEGRIMLKAHEDAPEPVQAPPLVAPVAATIASTPTFESEPDPVTDPAPEYEVAEDEVAVGDLAEAEVASNEGSDAPELSTEDSAAAFFANSPTVEEISEENEGSEEISVEAFTGYIAAGAADATEVADASEDDDEADMADQASTEEEPVDEPLQAEEVESETFAEAHDAPPEYADEHMSDDTVFDQADEVPADDATAADVAEIDPQEDPIGDATFEDGGEAEATDEVEELIIEQAEPASKSIFAAESFAEKLQRIRDVVSRDDAIDTDQLEDELDVPTGAISSFDAAQTLDEAQEVQAVEDDARPVPENPYIAEAAQDIETALLQDEDKAIDAAQSESDDLDEILSRIDAVSTDEESGISTTSEDHDNDNIFGAQEPASDKDKEEDIENVSVDGRILKVNRSALDAALESGELEEFDEEPEATENFSESQTNELQQNLAALKKIAEEEEEVAQKTNARESLPEIDESEDNDVSRLMAEADHQMDEPEGKTRRSAFAHLRAAVAARFADRSMDKDAQEEEEKEAEVYRSDLAEVVKPRRPASGSDEEKRAAAERPSPLKLVAEQRIDPEDGSDIDPVSPRRVAASVAEDLVLEDDTDFAGYADELGAHTLPEVLEAAAAYLRHVEGVREFSRPQLMSRVKQADCGEFTREDGLRAFGQLLRTGKIEKIKGGRFVASDAIGFKPGHRQAG